MDIEVDMDEINAAIAAQDAAWEAWGKPIADLVLDLFNDDLDR